MSSALFARLEVDITRAEQSEDHERATFLAFLLSCVSKLAIAGGRSTPSDADVNVTALALKSEIEHARAHFNTSSEAGARSQRQLQLLEPYLPELIDFSLIHGLLASSPKALPSIKRSVILIVAVVGAILGAIVAMAFIELNHPAPKNPYGVENYDQQVCRYQLGLSGLSDSTRKLTMACAAEVIEQEVKAGARGSDAAATAWDKCMPDLSNCDRALSH